MHRFTEKEEEISAILWHVGLKRNTARVLVVMFRETDLTSRVIEKIVDLRQPEVSVALRDLTKRRWIIFRERSYERKGRPEKIYRLALSANTILDLLKKEISCTYIRKLEEIERIRIMIADQKVEIPAGDSYSFQATAED